MTEQLLHEHNHEFLAFPKSFVWGTATSAHQTEGHAHNDWTRWEENPHHVWRGQRSGRASFSYERFAEDAELNHELGCNAARLSIEWSRIEPREGEFDEVALAHYRSVINAYRSRGARVMVTLHHFTNPIWFADRGGWERADAPKLFNRYVAHVAVALGGCVQWWITLNEPSLYAGLGYVRGVWPPGVRSKIRAARVLFHFMRAHRQAYATLHRACDHASHHTQVGSAVNMFSISNYEHSLADLFLVWALDWFFNHLFLDLTRHHHDFIGLNYYFHRRLERRPGTWFGSLVSARLTEQRETSDIGWEIFPQGISEVLHDVWSTYHLPIYITENGLATENEDKRARFIVAYLKEIYHTIAAGVPVRGYFYWSLIDNFEWEKGFAPRFGLVHVDFATGVRTRKPSSRVYEEIVRGGGISHRLLSFLGHGVHVGTVLRNV